MGTPIRTASIVTALLLAACETIPDTPLTEPAKVSDVLTSIKSELRLFESVAPSKNDPAVTSCTPAGPVRIVLTPETATLALKMIASNSFAGTAGVKFPIGGVVTANLGGSYSKANVRTQTVTFELGVAHTPSKRELRTAASATLKEIDEDLKAEKEVKSASPDVAKGIAAAAATKRTKLAGLYEKLLAEESPSSTTPTAPVDKNDDDVPDALSEAPLAAALWAAREELLQVDHNQQPCLKPGKLKVDIGFQVVRKAEGKAGISFLIVELGGQASATDDRTQSLAMVFDLADRSTNFAKEIRTNRAQQAPDFSAPQTPPVAVPVKPSPASSGTFVTYPFGTVYSSAIWNLPDWREKGVKQIPVCWENPSPTDQSYRVETQDAIAKTWERVSPLRFVGWGKCSITSKGIRILISDEGPHVKSLGRYLDAQPNGMVLNFQFEKWSPGCRKNVILCLRAVAAHEFGHALAFAHEQNRDDAPFECRKEDQGTKGNWNVTDYDPDSIMNYCNVKWNNNGDLSKRDIEAVQTIYGATL